MLNCNFAKLNRLSVSLETNKFKKSSIMVLRLFSGQMLEKSNEIGPLADRQNVLLTARLRVSRFLRFSPTRATENFQKISRELQEILESRKSLGLLGFGKFPKIVAENFFELDYFDIFFIFTISDLIFNILLCCFDKLSLVFLIFRNIK